ncbi:sugar phosphate isomerase family [Streptomonospora wellingtoniae]|uniref:Uncharacterized protein n=1 Tax=Streptomonospora wellingtoniae TaxID=3075544 RepID=A0ABU2KNM3_9ACTN|nr:hypothetical protein [Streptomonospora sp. DSM 45055]MDT0300871.1 hypothetical protein [Streptomonospora sp. DSM 45055]
MAVEYVGRALAEEVAAAVKDGDALGVAWSSTTVAMADALSQLRPCSVVQLAGAIYPPSGMPGSVEITRREAGGQSAYHRRSCSYREWQSISITIATRSAGRG